MKRKKFGIVTDAVVKDPDLSLRAKGVYALLASFANKERKCFPSINTLADYAGVSRRTIERALKELENKGIITKSNKTFRLK